MLYLSFMKKQKMITKNKNCFKLCFHPYIKIMYFRKIQSKSIFVRINLKLLNPKFWFGLVFWFGFVIISNFYFLFSINRDLKINMFRHFDLNIYKWTLPQFILLNNIIKQLIVQQPLFQVLYISLSYHSYISHSPNFHIFIILIYGFVYINRFRTL